MTHGVSTAVGLLAGKIVLVTGAGQGNGRAIAIGAAAAGAKVVVTDLRLETAQETASLIAAAGGEGAAYPLDVTDRHACQGLAERVRQEVGVVDVLVNNAGIILREGIDSPKAWENWRSTFDVNVHGVFNVVQAWLPALRETRGSIINIASIASFVGIGQVLGYSASKGAIKMFTQALAKDLAADGIRVNGIAPGVIATPMTAATRDDPSKLTGFMSRTPMARVGEPEELVGPVVFLASEMASYVTGAILPVDGGFLS